MRMFKDFSMGSGGLNIWIILIMAIIILIYFAGKWWDNAPWVRGEQYG